MGIDLGEARIGIALADGLGMFAHPRETVKIDRAKQGSDKQAFARIKEIIRQEGVGVIALGLPRNMDGTEGPAAAKARAFAERLRMETRCEVRLLDERLTTVAAQKALHAAGRNVKQGRAVIDQVAAQMILQTYLDGEALRQQAPPRAGRRLMDGSLDEPEAVGADDAFSRLALTIAYDGRPFRGWQSQAHGDTVQDRLEAAFSRLCGGRRIAVHGSGRTDAGVHARGQVAHADVPDRARHSPLRWRQALNAHLPAEIRVMRVRFADGDFHARYSARGKIYRYVIWNAAVMSPLRIGRAWHVPARLDLDILDAAVMLFVGTHDFAAFAANRGEPVPDTVRTIHSVSFSGSGHRLSVEYGGSGFLYKMVRLLTGSAVRCAQGKASLDWLHGLLDGKGKSNFVAPAEGLYLQRVLYDEPEPVA